MKTKIYLGSSQPKKKNNSKTIEEWDDFIKVCKKTERKKNIYKKPKYKNIFEIDDETFGETK